MGADRTVGRPDEASDDGRLATELLQPLVGTQLMRLRMGNGVRLELGTGAYEVTIETSLSVVREGEGWSGTPRTAQAVGAVLALNLSHVSSARVLPGGTLRLGFDAGEVVVPPDPDYEAWQVGGRGNLLIVCQPGGGLAIWKPDPEQQ